jgi:hypothetical protein
VPRRARFRLLDALLPALSGCTVMAVTGVAVGKGVVNAASAPFGNDKDK